MQARPQLLLAVRIEEQVCDPSPKGGARSKGYARPLTGGSAERSESGENAALTNTTAPGARIT
jgi:hypothetical protein